MKNIICFIIFLLLFSVAACSSNLGNPTSNDEIKIQDAFRSLYFARHGLHYPKYEERVDYCITNKVKDCLDSFFRVMDAKRFLVDQIHADTEHVLSITLDTISHYADLIPDQNAKRKSPHYGFHEQSTCSGAIIALYLFDREEQDRVIFNRFKNAPVKLLEQLFITDYEWQYNRPDPDRWIKLVEALPETTFSIYWKKNIVETLRKGKNKYKKFGIMLDRTTQ